MSELVGLRRLVRDAASEHQPAAVLQAAWRGLAAGRTPPDRLAPAWPDLRTPRLDALTAALGGAPPETLGFVYEALLALEPDRRGRQGSHYTPLELAAEVVAETLAPLLAEASETSPLRVCDPAMGGGVFLLAASAYLTARGLPHRLYGADKDPQAAAVARLAVWLASGEAPGTLVTGDALLGPVRDGEWPAEGDAVAWHELPGFGDGFDAVVGNPPFVGGSFISGRLGAAYRSELVARVAQGRRGNADLSAYFLLRGYDLLRPGGRLGLVLTNTIAEGDTRRIGLAHLLERGAGVTRAERDRPWPGEASLHYTLLWLSKRAPGQSPPPSHAALRPEPHRLAANAGVAFNGSKIYGQGFLLTAAEADAILQSEPHSADVIRPYLSGDDLYGRPDRAPSRLVICFRDWPLERAAEHRHCLDLVRKRVQPERARLAGRNSIGDRRAACWWQFGSYAPALYAAIAGRDDVLAKVLHSHTHAFCPTSADAVFSHALAIWADTDPALLAALQSSFHRVWALRHGSTLGIAPRYTLSRTFETFPLPPRTVLLQRLGRGLEAARSEVAREREVGLTHLAQHLAAPAPEADLAALRALEQQVDAAMLAAYGWDDLDAEHLRHDGPAPWYGPSDDCLAAVLDRLWELNLASPAVRT